MPIDAIYPNQINPIIPILEEASSCLQRCVSKVKEIWLAIVSCIVTYFTGIIEAFSWYSPQQIQIIKQLSQKLTENPPLVETMYLEELLSIVKSLPKSKDPVALMAAIDGTGARMEALIASVQVRVAALNEVGPAADTVYRESLEQFNRLQALPCTAVQRAWFVGQLTNIFRELDNRLSPPGDTLHRYCGCHIQPREAAPGVKDLAPRLSAKDPKYNVAHPVLEEHDPELPHPSAVLLSWSLGGGHNVVQHAMSQRLAEKGGHAYKVEADEEVLEGYYNLRKWTGRSGVEWGQFFLKNGWWRTIRFLGWLSSGTDSPSAQENKVRRFALPLLARGDQDVAVMCFTRHTASAEKAAGRLGIACDDIATDLDYQVFGFTGGAENPHFRHALMAADPIRQAESLDQDLRAEEVVDGGFPVREAFLKQYTAEEINALRAQYKQNYGLADDARVVILLCGGEGVSNTFAETLVKQYPRQPNAPKVHLFAICGRNQDKKQQLETRFASLNSPIFKASAIGWADDTLLGELFGMAALDPERQGQLISAKAGGGSISEAIARGIPTLVYDMNDVVHEKKNISFLTEKGLGVAFKKERELPALLAQSLQTPFTPQVAPTGEAYSQFDSKRKSMKVLGDLVLDARRDEAFRALQPSRLRLPPIREITA